MGTREKQVAHVIGPSLGGMRRHVRYLAMHPPSGYRTIGVWGPGDLEEYFAGAGFRPAGLAQRLRPPPDADLVHAHGFQAACVALRRRRPPVVVTVHIDLETQGRTARSNLLRGLARFAVGRAEAVIAVSQRAARRFPGARVIAPATDRLPPAARSRAEVRAAMGTPDDRIVVVTVARLHRDKGLETFIRAVAEAGAEGWICGDGPLRSELERRAEGTAVRLLGYRADVPDILEAADMFALPSVGEAYGIAVTEAIGAGLPVVVTSAGAMPEIAGGAGLVVPAGDTDAFAEAVRRITGDAALRAELAARARRMPPPDPAEIVRRIGEVYDEVTRR